MRIDGATDHKANPLQIPLANSICNPLEQRSNRPYGVTMAIADTEDKILADLEAVMRRAISFGRRLEKDAFRKLLEVSDETPTPPKLKSKTPDKPKLPYGFVKKSVGAAIAAYPTGIARDRIKPFVAKNFEVVLEESAIQTALRTLSDDGDAEYKERFWFPSKQLLASIKALEEQEKA